MNPGPDPVGLTPEELALLAAYQDGSLSSGEIEAVGELLSRSEAAREVLSETSALLGRAPGAEDEAVPWSEGPPSTGQGGRVATSPGGPAPPHRHARMGWRSFLPLATAGMAVIFLLWPRGETLSLSSWSDDLARQGGSEPFPFPVTRGSGAQDDVAETAGVRWVDLRVAAAAGRQGEFDTLARELAGDLADASGSGPARAQIDALVELEALPSRDLLQSAQLALVERFGPDFEEAVILATLRRAAGAGDAEFAVELLEQDALDDGLGEDLDPEVRSRLLELCEGTPGPEELAEMESVVTDLLRRRTR